MMLPGRGSRRNFGPLLVASFASIAVLDLAGVALAQQDLNNAMVRMGGGSGVNVRARFVEVLVSWRVFEMFRGRYIGAREGSDEFFVTTSSCCCPFPHFAK